MSEEAPTIAERYTRSTQTSDLRVRETPCDADTLIAAGWCGDGIGASLYRLRAEFDRAHSLVRDGRPLNLAERVLVLSRLKSLPSVKEAMGKDGLRAWTYGGYPERNVVDVQRVIGRVLQAWLDPTCDACEGRGFNGGGRLENSGPKVLCRPCGSTGKRFSQIGRDDAERRFAAFYLAKIERQVSEAEKAMARFLRSRG